MLTKPLPTLSGLTFKPEIPMPSVDILEMVTDGKWVRLYPPTAERSQQHDAPDWYRYDGQTKPEERVG